MQSRKAILKATINAVLGNALEIYDFAIYGLFAHILAEQFFPAEGPFLSFLMSLAVYATGFFMRPIGGLILGQVGDKHGRRKALIFSLMIMSISTFMIGLLPNYQQIGLLAPIAVLICRLAQGFSAGAEYCGASIFMVEYYKSKNLQGFSGGLSAASGALGALLAVVFTYGLNIFLPEAEWAWRIPFLFGGVLAVSAIYMRHQIDESPEYVKEKATSSKPLQEIFTSFKAEFFKTIFVGMVVGAYAYLVFVYIKLYMMKHTTITASNISDLHGLMLMAYFAAAPIWGYISDRRGHQNLFQFGSILAAVTIYPIFQAIQTADLIYCYPSVILLAIIAAAIAGPANAYMSSLYPTKLRFTGVAFGYGIGSALLGGTLPLIVESSINATQDPLVPAYYLMLASFFGILATSRFSGNLNLIEVK